MIANPIRCRKCLVMYNLAFFGALTSVLWVSHLIVPLQSIADDVAGQYKRNRSEFCEIAEARKVVEEGRAIGKLVVKI